MIEISFKKTSEKTPICSNDYIVSINQSISQITNPLVGQLANKFDN